MRRIGVGIVGLSAGGGWASRAHVPALQVLADRFQLVGLCGSSPAAAAEAAAKFAVPFHTEDADALAARPDVDLVVVAVKVPDHGGPVRAAMGAGKAVFCEWPLAVNEAEAMELSAAAAAAGIRTFVGLQARSASALGQLKRQLAEGLTGEILSSSILAGVGMPWDGTTDSKRTYLNRRESGATMLSIPFGHCFDALTWLLGPFREFHSSLAIRRSQVSVVDTGELLDTDVADQIIMGGILETGAAASIHYRGGLSAAGNFRWEINGTHGDILITGRDGHLQYGLIDIRLSRGGESALQALKLQDQANTDSLPPHARAVARQYAFIHDDITRGGNRVPDFAEAARLHRALTAIEATATE
jgi:predicted dehydrogenase